MKKPSKNQHFAEMLRPFEDKWVALSPDRSKVISSGGTLKEVESKIDPKEIEDMIFMKVPPVDTVFIAPLHEI